MLADQERFDIVEQRLRKNGDLDKYEEKYGPTVTSGT